MFVVQIVQYLFIGNFCDGDEHFVPLGVEALHVVFLKLDSQQVAEVKNSFACTTELKVVPLALPCRLAS